MTNPTKRTLRLLTALSLVLMMTACALPSPVPVEDGAGTTASIADKMIDFPRFNHFIGLDTYKKLEREYKVDRDD